jgi:hypothetical protein
LVGLGRLRLPSSVIILKQKHRNACISIARADTQVLLSLKATATTMDAIVLEEGFWRKPIDFTLSSTEQGRFYKQFHQHVRPLKSTTAGVSFHQYIKLPAELQLRVLGLCDAPTLFQFMRASRHLRAEAKKLFFSDQKTWYYLYGNHLLDGCPAESTYDIDFLACVQQLDLECGANTERLITESVPNSNTWPQEPLKFDEKDFWQMIQRLFPRLKRVIFSQEARLPLDKDPVARCYRNLAQVCPQGIDVTICAAETEENVVGDRRKRVYWRLRAGQEDVDADTTLERDELLKSPLMLVVPPRKAYRGPVGEFLKAEALFRKWHDQGSAADMYEIAAVEKYHFEKRHEPFDCCQANCIAWFEQPDQYTTHLLWTGHGETKPPPGKFRTLFAENSNRLERLAEDEREAHSLFWDWWLGDDDAKRHRIAKRAVIDQLEHDALYKQNKPLKEHGLWRKILRNDYYWEC